MKQMDRAIQLFLDLRLWEEAKVFAANGGGGVDLRDLTRRQAQWAEETRDWKVGRPLKLVEMYGLNVLYLGYLT